MLPKQPRTERRRRPRPRNARAREAGAARAVAEREVRRLTVGLAASVVALVTIGTVEGDPGGAATMGRGCPPSCELRLGVETVLDKTRVAAAGRAGRKSSRAILEQTRPDG